jgi:DNA-binding NarL/FixJ family response regulator
MVLLPAASSITQDDGASDSRSLTNDRRCPPELPRRTQVKAGSGRQLWSLAAAQLRDIGVKAKVVFLTMHRDVAYARRAMEAGAAGFVLKHSVASELVTAVREALRGQIYVTPMIAGELLQSYREADSGPRDSVQRLTARQREVLQLFAEGRTAKEVAALLKISIRTAEAHKAHILDALGLRSTAELVQYAIRNGIISV